MNIKPFVARGWGREIFWKNGEGRNFVAPGMFLTTGDTTGGKRKGGTISILSQCFNQCGLPLLCRLIFGRQFWLSIWGEKRVGVSLSA